MDRTAEEHGDHTVGESVSMCGLGNRTYDYSIRDLQLIIFVFLKTAFTIGQLHPYAY